jgi:hypothetical protein
MWACRVCHKRDFMSRTMLPPIQHRYYHCSKVIISEMPCGRPGKQDALHYWPCCLYTTCGAPHTLSGGSKCRAIANNLIISNAWQLGRSMRSCHLEISINLQYEAGAGAGGIGGIGGYDRCITAPGRADLKGQQQGDEMCRAAPEASFQ